MDDVRARPRPRHLMDPTNPRPQASSGMSLTRVQRWVISVLVLVSVMHFAAGLVFAGLMLDPSKTGNRIGLQVLAGVVGVIAVAGARLIHRRSPVSPWLLVGLAPAAVGLYFL